MNGWMKEENTMIACCSDGTGPVIFKIEQIDYEVTVHGQVYREVFFVSEGHRKPEGSRRQNGRPAHFVCIMLL